MLAQNLLLWEPVLLLRSHYKMLGNPSKKHTPAMHDCVAKFFKKLSPPPHICSVYQIFVSLEQQGDFPLMKSVDAKLDTALQA